MVRKAFWSCKPGNGWQVSGANVVAEGMKYIALRHVDAAHLAVVVVDVRRQLAVIWVRGVCRKSFLVNGFFARGEFGPILSCIVRALVLGLLQRGALVGKLFFEWLLIRRRRFVCGDSFLNSFDLFRKRFDKLFDVAAAPLGKTYAVLREILERIVTEICKPRIVLAC